jgi:hypothetical protein
MTRRLSIFLLAALYGSATAWLAPSSPSQRVSALNAVHDSSHRRAFLSSIRTAACFGLVATTTPAVARADEKPDPFAELDAIAEKIRSSSQFPNSSSPLPTYKKMEQELTTPLEESTAPPPPTMEEALKEARKRKRTDPLTHG